MEKIISINVDIKVNNKDKLKRILKISLYTAAGIASLIGVLNVVMFYQYRVPLYFLIFALVFTLSFCASAALRAAGKRSGLCSILIGIFAALYQIYNSLLHSSNNFDGLIPLCVITALFCVSASIISMVISCIIDKHTVRK